jgi:protein-L-isoaspartate(D-aspartate) O-methyltransferase
MAGDRRPDEAQLEVDRERMIRDQLVARGIRSEAVLGAMRRVPRHLFVDPDWRDRAYDDVALPTSDGQTISQPYMVALMTEALALDPAARVLEVGTGTGYQAAVLAAMGAEVFTIERIGALAHAARERLEAIGFAEGIHFAEGDGSMGWPGGGRFDGIVVTAGAPEVPPALVDALEPGGHLVLPVGDRRLQYLLRLTRTDRGTETERLVSCAFVPLVGREGWTDEPRDA